MTTWLILWLRRGCLVLGLWLVRLGGGLDALNAAAPMETPSFQAAEPRAFTFDPPRRSREISFR